MPKVSVIITTYNRAHLIEEAMKSALNQTFRDFEVIVVDDGSTDNTKGVLEKYASRMRYIFQENKGRSEAKNSGIKAAGGEYIAFLDDDDIWLPFKLEKQVAYLDNNPDIGLVHNFIEVFDEQCNFLPGETKKHYKFYKKAMRRGYTYQGMSKLCIMFLSAVMLRKDCLDKVGFFDPTIPAFEDWDFYLRFALAYRIGTVSEPLVKFRLHRGHTSNDEFIRGQIKTSQKHLALLNSLGDIPFRKRIGYNFYTHLSNAYYMAKDLKEFRKYALEALKLNPSALFGSRLGLHFFMTLLPHNLILGRKLLIY